VRTSTKLISNPLKTQAARILPAVFFTMLLSLLVTPMKSNAQTNPTAEFDEISITYKLSIQSKSYGNATLGKLTNTLSKTDVGFSAKSVTKTQGIAAILIGSNEQQSCDFIMENGLAIPQRYSGGTLKKDQYDVAFDWQKKTITFEGGESLDMPKGYVLDICSMPFAFALQQGKKLKKKRVRGYTQASSEEAIIDTPLGKKKTIKIVLQRELRPDRILTLWLSIEDQYIPVQIEEKRKSRTTTMVVSAMNIE